MRNRTPPTDLSTHRIVTSHPGSDLKESRWLIVRLLAIRMAIQIDLVRMEEPLDLITGLHCVILLAQKGLLTLLTLLTVKSLPVLVSIPVGAIRLSFP